MTSIARHIALDPSRASPPRTMRQPVRGRELSILALMLGICTALAPSHASAGYIVNDLVSDLPGVAPVTDPNLVNPWGLASTPTSPIWVSDNHTGVATLYNGAGQPFPVASPLVVTIPPPLGGMPAAPTGVVFNPTADFGGAHFIFATEDGTVSAWTSGTAAVLKFDNSASGAVYKGVALGNNGAANLLYATNFNAGKIDVLNSSFAPVSLSGSFTDPLLPAGYAPFGIQNIGGKLYVSYALQNAAKHDDVAGPGHGFIDVFDTNGNLLERLASMGSLNSPWGLALAPGDFGTFSHDLLVGNFGDGTINAFNPATGAFLGQLDDTLGNPITIDGLWGLLFGNGGNGGPTDELFFSAGIPGPNGMKEDHGLFGDLAAVPEPSTIALFLSGLALLGVNRNRRR